MAVFLNFVLFFNLLGVFLSFMAITIVAHAARVVIGQVRHGLLSFLWGLSFILVSFFYAILYVYRSGLPDLQSVLLAVGMLMIMLSTRKLFSFYKPSIA